jgi:hypothetical protein
MRRILVLCLVAVAMLAGGVWSAYSWYFPYGQSHCCDKQLRFSLENYADQHGGRYPSGEKTPEASLSLLIPDYSNAHVLRGKTVPLETVENVLSSGRRLDPDSCGWHYVEGLTKSDDGRIAIFWDKVGLGHNGQRLLEGGHSVYFLNYDHRVVSADEWPQFLEEQAKLIASRNEQAKSGQPALIAIIRLPSGKIVDHFEGNWRLETRKQFKDGSSQGEQSGSGLGQSELRWYHLADGRITYVLTLVEKGWRSEPVTVEVRNGKANPSSITFDMETR